EVEPPHDTYRTLPDGFRLFVLPEGAASDVRIYPEHAQRDVRLWHMVGGAEVHLGAVRFLGGTNYRVDGIAVAYEAGGAVVTRAGETRPDRVDLQACDLLNGTANPAFDAARHEGRVVYCNYRTAGGARRCLQTTVLSVDS